MIQSLIQWRKFLHQHMIKTDDVFSYKQRWHFIRVTNYNYIWSNSHRYGILMSFASSAETLETHAHLTTNFLKIWSLILQSTLYISVTGTTIYQPHQSNAELDYERFNLMTRTLNLKFGGVDFNSLSFLVQRSLWFPQSWQILGQVWNEDLRLW